MKSRLCSIWIILGKTLGQIIENHIVHKGQNLFSHPSLFLLDQGSRVLKFYIKVIGYFIRTIIAEPGNGSDRGLEFNVAVSLP